MLLTKLFFLGVRQVAKPLAERAKNAAKQNQTFRNLVVNMGRTLHSATIQITRSSEGKDALHLIVPLNEKAAIERGSYFFSEALIYSISGSIVYYEYYITQRSVKAKEEVAAAAEASRRAEIKANEERQWAEFSELNRRITLMQEELWSLRQREERRRDAELERAQRRSGWWWGSNPQSAGVT
jgi:hypothetical protein